MLPLTHSTDLGLENELNEPNVDEANVEFIAISGESVGNGGAT